MSTGVVPSRTRKRTPVHRTRGLLPEPAPRPGAHGHAGKRVRDDVRDGIAVMVFSLVSALLVALAITALARIAG
ncbi:MAG: hypothetical protein M3419_02190 [Actinomycetota bacterium]|nr:hypothetical protein [Actinomycetota bacterium]